MRKGSDSSRGGGLLEGLGTMLFEPHVAAFDFDTGTQTEAGAREGSSESFEEYIARCQAANVRVWKVVGAIAAAASCMIGLWMLFKIA